MAVIKDNDEVDPNITSEILQRLDILEQHMSELHMEAESSNLELYLQGKRLDILSTKQEKESKKQCWQERLVFKEPSITADSVWRGSVEHSFAQITKDLLVDSNSYIGATYDPERRFREHVRKEGKKTMLTTTTSRSSLSEPDFYGGSFGNRYASTSSPSSVSSPSTPPASLLPTLQMNILYHTTSSGKAADLESRLLWKYPTSRNVSCHANGILYGKPSYFVYLLRFLKK